MFTLISTFTAPKPVTAEPPHLDTQLVESLAAIGLDEDQIARVTAPVTESTGITPDHYAQWLDVIEDTAMEQGTSLTSRNAFNEIAFEVLDNDSFVDSLSGGEQLKMRIVKALWSTKQAAKAHAQIGTVASPSQENEEQFVTAYRDAYEDEQRSIKADSLIGKAVTGDAPVQGNPYPAGSLRANLWDQLHGNEDEESDANYLPPGTPASEVTKMADDTSQRTEDDELESRVGDLEHRVANLEEPEADGEQSASPDTQSGAGEEEASADELARKIMSQPRAEENEESNALHRAVTAPKHEINAALKAIETDGAKAWKKVAQPKNPHPSGSQAYQAWARGFKHAAKDHLGLVKVVTPVKPKKRK